MDENQIVYDKIVTKSKTGHQYVYTKKSLKKLDKILPKKGKILDVGCGTGHIAQELNDREWYGIDISPKSIKFAKKFYRIAKIGDVTKRIPFNDKTFDYVISVSFLHHVPLKLDEAIKEIRRVLKPNGEFIAIEHDDRNLWKKMMHHSFLRVVPCEGEMALNIKILKRVLLNNGFKNIRVGPFELEAEQQALKPPLFIRVLKGPLLYVLKIVSRNRPSEFIIKAK